MEGQWNWQPGEGCWPARLTFTPVGSAQWGHLEVMHHLRARHMVNLPPVYLDAWNAARTAERADWSFHEALVDPEAVQRATLAWLDGLDGEKLAITGLNPALRSV